MATHKKRVASDQLKRAKPNAKHLRNVSKNDNKHGSIAKQSDWLSSLVAQTILNDQVTLSKEDRIIKRQAKKVDRQEKKNEQKVKDQSKKAERNISYGFSAKLAEERIKRLDERITQYVHRLNAAHPKPYRSPDLRIETDKLLGKAVHGRGPGLTERLLEPRPKDYGGCGLARSSLYVDLRDPSFIPKLEEEFAEHIEGFKTKVISKAMKKQLDGNMLWRQLQQSKKVKDKSNNKKAGLLNKKIHGKKLSAMNPDERVEAMIEAGLI